MNDSTASGFFTKLGRLWCKFAHDDLMWPMHGRYQCRRCLQYHPIPWERNAEDDQIVREFTAATEHSPFY